MIAEPTSPYGRKTVRPPFFSVPDEAATGPERPGVQTAPAAATTTLDGDGGSGQETGLEAHPMHGVADVTDVSGADPDVADLSSSHGDGARYAVALARTRHARGRSAAAGQAKVRLRQAIHGVRRVAVNALRQRMTTEMADLAAQIRKLHDQDGSRR